MPIDCGGYAGPDWDDSPQRLGWKSPKEPPPSDSCVCIALIDDKSERAATACYGPSGEFEGWMFEATLAPDESERFVIGWKST